MNLQIRNPRAYELAKKLAEKNKMSMSDIVIRALEEKLEREPEEKSLWERVQPIIERLHSRAKPGGRDMTKEEIDAMWGHE